MADRPKEDKSPHERPPSALRRTVWSVLRIAAGVYVGLIVILFLFQGWFLYYPKRQIPATPDRFAMPYEAVTLQTADGLRLAAWYVPCPAARGTVLYCHGNGGNLGYWVGAVGTIHQAGLNVLIFDYRGYGQSEGSPSEEGTYADAEAAWRYLVEERRVPPAEIIIHGRSLGGAVAAWLARKHPPRALILESSFTSVPDRAAKMLPFVPVRLILRYEYNTLEYLKGVHCPILIIHSRQDNLIPFEHGRRLFEVAEEPKTFLEIHGSHNDGAAESQELYERGLEAFLSAH
jgi:fermentation-respiration switch protein FrsA (DUF1100 family)